MTEFRTGQRVKVEAFEGVINHVGSDYVDVHLVDRDGIERETIEFIDLSLVTVVVENWPPQLGDIWAVDGAEWYARQSILGTNRITLVPENRDSTLYDQHNFDRFKDFNPVLVRRR